MSDKKKLKQILKETADTAKLKLSAYFGNEAAQETLKNKKLDELTNQYFGDIKETMGKEELRKYVRMIYDIEKSDFEENTKKSKINRRVNQVKTLASLKKFNTSLNKNASFAKWIKEGENAQKYQILLEYISFRRTSLIAYMDEDFLKQVDDLLKKSLSPKDLNQYYKLCDIKSFEDIKRLKNPQEAAKEQKEQEHSTANYGTACYR